MSNAWYLVDAQVESGEEVSSAVLCVQILCSSDLTARVVVPVLPTGRIHEVVSFLPGSPPVSLCRTDGGALQVRWLKFKRLALFERVWRMANRVFDCFTRIPPQQRLESGISFPNAVIDLTGAYIAATTLRRAKPYDEWVAEVDIFSEIDASAIKRHIASFPSLPGFQIFVVVEGAGDERQAKTLASLGAQLYHHFSVNVLDASRGEADPALSGEWVLLLRAGDVLPPHALYWFACGVLANPAALILYADEDALDANGQRTSPRLKPDWSMAHIRSTNFVGDALVLKADAILALGGPGDGMFQHGSFDLLLRLVDAAGDEGRASVVHLPAVLLHRAPREDEGAWNDPAWSRDAVLRHLQRNSVAAEVFCTAPGLRQLRYRLPDPLPLVSIVVPTRDGFDLLRQCVDSLLGKTTYPRFEILVVDNQSADPAALAYLAGLDGLNAGKDRGAVRVLRYARPFNYSAINNFAVDAARGEVLCLLNNDTEVISPDWLEEMLGQLIQPGVGIVGAKLYFPDGRVQHAGDVVGPGGCANHLHSRIHRDDPGYCNRAAVVQELSAVTAACLLTWRSVYQTLGGLDTKYLKVAFNDVDFCLRARKAGHKVVWTPHAELYHHESVSRGKDKSWRQELRAEKEVWVMRRRWKHVMLNDPFYNPNLSYARPDFSMSHVRRVKRPWD